jgi:hypothetical protein
MDDDSIDVLGSFDATMPLIGTQSDWKCAQNVRSTMQLPHKDGSSFDPPHRAEPLSPIVSSTVVVLVQYMHSNILPSL